MKITIIIRTLDDPRYLEDALEAIELQTFSGEPPEILVVDSDEDVRTRAIAERHGARMVPVKQNEFTFGRALNLGCLEANGEILVFLSGHCIPTSSHWLEQLIEPLVDGVAAYSYGRQQGGALSEYSESQHFNQYFPQESEIPQSGCFCSNANAAITAEAWKQFRFDESLTGLEDIKMAKELSENRYRVAYVAEASVYHIHHEEFSSVMTRFAREAYALETIMPNIHFTLVDFAHYFVTGVAHDVREAFKDKCLHSNLYQILAFRLAQYWGAYLGHRRHRTHSNRAKHSYFNPDKQHKIR